MKYVTFTPEEKVKLFDEIAKRYYDANFGQLSKVDMELLMFRFYIEKLIDSNKNADGTIDYNKCSDFKISTDLGITQQRVRNLKIKNQLTHPTKYDWKKALAGLMGNARYDEKTHKVMMNIPDPNLFLEIRNFIEEQGAFVETQLNPKLLQMRAEYFLALAIELEEEPEREKVIKALKKAFSAHEKENVKFDEMRVAKSLLNSAVDISSVVANVAGCFSDGNAILKALKSMLKINGKSE